MLGREPSGEEMEGNNGSRHQYQREERAGVRNETASIVGPMG